MSKYFMALAQEMGKKIIAIEPWGAERTSTTVKIMQLRLSNGKLHP